MFDKLYCQRHGRQYYSPSICPECSDEAKRREQKEGELKVDSEQPEQQRRSKLWNCVVWPSDTEDEKVVSNEQR